MPERILTQTANLLRLYKHLIGKSEVPLAFHMWSFISMLAACVEDRVWIYKGKDKLFPHLYVFLIGSAASGKGTAIRRVRNLFDEAKITEALYGQTTAWDFADRLCRTYEEHGETIGPFPKVFLITEELSHDIGDAKLAKPFMRLMTKLYTDAGEKSYTGTRTHGRFVIEDPCVNWLMGSNMEDLIESLDKNAAGSGFFSRVAPVMSEYDSTLRFWEPIIPPDYEEVRMHILVRLWNLKQITGQFVIEDEAVERGTRWYHNRKFPETKEEQPNWKREQDLVLKLSMILCLADGGALVIRRAHLEEAIKMSASVQKNIPKLVELSKATNETEVEDKLLDIFRKLSQAPTVQERKIRLTELGDRMRKRGVPSRVMKNILLGLIHAGTVKCERDVHGAAWYWLARRG
jgi:hypothetical protein